MTVVRESVMYALHHIAPASKEHTICCPVPIVIAGLIRDWGIQWTALM